MVDIVQQVSTDIVLSDKSEAEAGTNNTKFMTPLRTKEAIDKNTSNLLPNTSIVQVEGNATDKVMSQAATTASIATAKTELTNQIGAAVLPFNAMSQSQFEAIRAANNEEFAASGFVHFGQHLDQSNYVAINQGLYTSETLPNIIVSGRKRNGNKGTSKTLSPVINISGVLFYIDNVSQYANDNSLDIKFPQAPDGKTTYNKSTGAIVTHADSTTAFAAQQADPTNVEVVINRVDMWGFEAWLEEVNSTNPFVYPNGLIQSQATTMDGITTSASARPVTYYAVFDGDTGSKGKGVNFFTLTDAQKKKVLGNHKNNLYYLDDGRLVQWRLRQRSFAGAGNGDWINIDTTASANSGQLSFSIKHAIKTHGAQNTAKPNDAATDGYQFLNQTSPNWLDGSGLGIWARHKSVATQSVNGELFFLVCGTVNRLNQGAYHPSFNPSGTASWRSAQQSYWACSWDNRDSRTKLSGEPTRTADCFTALLGAPGNGGFGDIGNAAYDGYNRPDKRFHNAIYADGFGGVCRDMRYSAYGLTPTDFADADQRVKNGTYRGFEKAVFSKVIKTTLSEFGGYAGGNYFRFTGYDMATAEAGVRVFFPKVGRIGFPCVIEKSTGGGLYLSSKFLSDNTVYLASGGKLTHFPLSQDGMAVGDEVYIIHQVEIPLSIGGSFLQTDVIGSPERILATPQLANGWQGSWIPTTSGDWIMSRKAVNPTGTQTYTSNNGASWATTSLTINGVTNGTPAGSSSLVWIAQYQAFAKQTKPSANAVVYGGLNGVGVVATGCAYYVDRGVLLAESLINKIMTNSNIQNIHNSNLAVIESRIGNDTSKFDPADWGYPRHYPLSYVAPTNNSAAFKALNYNVNINQQGFINYAYTELKHNGTNWGDDSKVTIVDNQSTKTDLNGNTVLVGTAQTCESLGWIKNKL